MFVSAFSYVIFICSRTRLLAVCQWWYLASLPYERLCHTTSQARRSISQTCCYLCHRDYSSPIIPTQCQIKMLYTTLSKKKALYHTSAGPPGRELACQAHRRCLRIAFFFIFIFKKNKISKIYAEQGNFQKWVSVAPLMGDKVPVAHPVGDRT